VRPEEEAFDTRARILFRRESGAHIDYIVRRIKDSLEHYAERTDVTANILDYHVAENKYQIRTIVRIIVRSYIDDIDTRYKSDCHFSEATPAPAGVAKNRLVYLTAGGTPIGVAEEFETSIKREVETTIEKDGECVVEYMSEIWMLADQEPNSYSPRRYTQALSLSIGNLCRDCASIKVALTSGGTNRTTVDLLYGQTRTLVRSANIEPLIEVYNYNVLAP